MATSTSSLSIQKNGWLFFSISSSRGLNKPWGSVRSLMLVGRWLNSTTPCFKVWTLCSEESAKTQISSTCRRNSFLRIYFGLWLSTRALTVRDSSSDFPPKLTLYPGRCTCPSFFLPREDSLKQANWPPCWPDSVYSFPSGCRETRIKTTKTCGFWNGKMWLLHSKPSSDATTCPLNPAISECHSLAPTEKTPSKPIQG